MKSVPKLIRRCVGILLLSVILLLVLNIIAFTTIVSTQTSGIYPWTTAKEAAQNLKQTEDGYVLPENIKEELQSHNAWGIFIDNDTLQVVWQTDKLPDSVPLSYTASGIARLTRGYIDGYPTFTGEAENGLMVLGYPKDSFWKDMWPSFDYDLIANSPKILFSILSLNIAAIFLIYVVANSKLLHSIKPITNGIQALPMGEPVYIKEKGLLSELAAHINRTSEVLQSQNYQLRKKETARANWIAGVSHDIRTPLSMVMGYAGQLKEDTGLTEQARRKADTIVKQSERIRNLIGDLNLASKLEYNMQPITPAKENLIAIARQVVVDYINMDTSGKHPIIWETDETLSGCPVYVDKNLMKRAVSNLIQNSINHNEQGCTIYVCVTSEDNKCSITVSDDGIGATDEQIEKLNHAPHYMVCDENTSEQRHGLGLLIVKQIVASHNGTVTIDSNAQGGFSVQLTLPMQD